MLNPQEITGQTATHIVDGTDGGAPMHRRVVGPFQALKEAAAGDGIDLVAMSGFRGFNQQASIWNAKWDGQRTLYDKQSRPVDHAKLSPLELAHTILIWSALPGASRHHWGTDIDVYDARAKPENYVVQLLPEEYDEGGYFHTLYCWLLANMGRFGFFLPYKEDRGGISNEPWHISHAPLAVPALDLLTPDLLAEAVAHGNLQGREVVAGMIPEIHRRYVRNICPPGPDVAME